MNELRDEIYSDAVAHGLCAESYLCRTLMSNNYLKNSKTLQVYKITKAEQETRRVNATLRALMEKQELLESELEVDYFTDELADVIITALSVAGYLGIDIDKVVRAKMEINRGR